MNKVDILLNCSNQPCRVGRLIELRYAPNQIAKILGVSESTVPQYIDRAACDSIVNFVQVYLALTGLTIDLQRLVIQQIKLPLVGAPTTSPSLSRKYERLAIAEHYLQIREIERTLHESIKRTLIELFGSSEDGWWRQGIPKDIRSSCAAMRENDSSGVSYDPFTYTNFMDLKKILQMHRKNYQDSFAFLKGLSNADCDQFLNELEELNAVRNTVMHPVRVDVPHYEQLLFVQKLHEKIHPQ